MKSNVSFSLLKKAERSSSVLFSKQDHISGSKLFAKFQAPRLECIPENYFSYFSTKTYVVGTQKNRLDEHPKYMFKLMDKKIDKKIITILRLKNCLTGPMR